MRRTMNSAEHELLAKNNLVVAQVLGAIVALAQMYQPSQDVLVGALLVCTMVLSTVSTFSWMSR